MLLNRSNPIGHRIVPAHGAQVHENEYGVTASRPVLVGTGLGPLKRLDGEPWGPGCWVRNRPLSRRHGGEAADLRTGDPGLGEPVPPCFGLAAVDSHEASGCQRDHALQVKLGRRRRAVLLIGVDRDRRSTGIGRHQRTAPIRVLVNGIESALVRAHEPDHPSRHREVPSRGERLSQDRDRCPTEVGHGRLARVVSKAKPWPCNSVPFPQMVWQSWGLQIRVAGP